MTTIKQLLAMPINQRWGGDEFTIKIAGKKLQDANNEWTQHIVLSDKTGEIDADVFIRRNVPLVKGGRIHIIISEIQSATNKIGKKLYVDQFTQPTQTVDEFQSKQDEMDKEVKLIVRSKIKCWQVAGYLSQQGVTPHDAKVFAKSEVLDEIVDAIIGE